MWDPLLVFAATCMLRVGGICKGDIAARGTGNTGNSWAQFLTLSAAFAAVGALHALPRGNSYSWPESHRTCTTQRMCYCIHTGGPAN